ncbi:GntR family transcriptional regulator [Streptomyces sp. bgisy159]|uniref:GntR family transcriptional regulator n=1 Tax=Streptomyces sp. bgisy159 TaxID=3413795 RepID=UPI003F49D506
MTTACEMIADDLRRSIREGEYEPGDRPPSERELAGHHEHSVPVARTALQALAGERLIDEHDGHGDAVRDPRTLVVRDSRRHQWKKNRARAPRAERTSAGATDHDTGPDVRDPAFRATHREIEAPRDLSRACGVPEGTPLHARTYLTRRATEPAPPGLVTSFLVRETIAAGTDLLDAHRKPWPGGPQSQPHTVGTELDRIQESVTARPPTPHEARAPDLPPRASVTPLRTTSCGIDGRVVEIADVTLPGDRRRLLSTTPLERW